MAQSFRTDIEGLRALAVLPILVFHLESTLCPGGFVGVDIFFVISGYLITRMILVQGTTFSFRDFYKRRFFRLFPALVATTAITLIAAWRLLGPEDYAALARSALAAIFGVSNVYFLNSVDYFNASSLSHPLLHTWSLGVEEQFYLFWPALLIFAARTKIGVVGTTIAAALISLLCLAYLQGRAPLVGFYLVPARIFEFATGALIVLAERNIGTVARWVCNVVGAAGCILLIGSLVYIDANTPWPGGWTFLPVAATAALIFAGRGGLWRLVLSAYPLRLIGRYSYSIYLVHWPIITLFRSANVLDPSGLQLLMLGVASLIAGAVLYVTVEVLFRYQQPSAVMSLPWRFVPRSVVTAVLVTVSGAVAIVTTEGMPHRLKGQRVQEADNTLTYGGDLCGAKRGRCIFGDASSGEIVYLIGDSTATHLVAGLDSLFKELKVKGVALYGHGCLHAYGTTRFEKGVPNAVCRARIAEAYETLAKDRRPVIFSGDYASSTSGVAPADATIQPRYTETELYAWLKSRFVEGFEKIDAQNRRMIVFKQAYSTGVDLPKCYAQLALSGTKDQAAIKCVPMSLAQNQQHYAQADQLIDKLRAEIPTISVVDPKVVFCNTHGCSVRNETNALLFRDAAHLTKDGSEFLIRALRSELIEALKPAHPLPKVPRL